MSLPSAWVDRIWEKLALVYGQPFLRRWDGQDVARVKADWGYELSGFEQWPEAIAHALAHLPTDSPPTVLQFRLLARSAPQPSQLALPSPPADPSRVSAALAKIQRPEPRDPKAWAWKLRAREAATPRSLSATQRVMWRAALETDLARQRRIDEEVMA